MAGKIINILVKDLEKNMHDDTIIVDVREVHEYQDGAIPNSINLPLSTLTKDKVEQYINKDIIVTCRSGMRSLKAASYILEWFGKDIKNLKEGYMGYINR